MLQCVPVSQYAHRGRSACLYSYHQGFVGQEAVASLAEVFEGFLETLRHEIWHPEVHGCADNPWGVGCAWHVVAHLAVDEMSHALRRSCLSTIALQEGCILEPLLKLKHGKWGIER